MIMNKAAMKNFALRVRKQLLEAVTEKACALGITQNTHPLPETADGQLRQLLETVGQKGYSYVIEETAYGRFSRLIALRFMEVNGYLPSEGVSALRKNQVLSDLLGEPHGWTSLLLPDSLPDAMWKDMSDENFREVEALGWLHQFYLSAKHEAVIDPLHGKVISKEDIPAATQLFTPRWVVRYILDNSLGRYWLERHPESDLRDNLTYLVTPKDGSFQQIQDPVAPEELKILDPCVGAGHFLTYAFDLLMEIYRQCGRSDEAAARAILEHNLYGLDIDDRVVRLARFAVLMKARKYDCHILENEPTLHICAIQDSDLITNEFLHDFAKDDAAVFEAAQALRSAFDNAKEYGSMISIPNVNFAVIEKRLAQLPQKDAQSQRLLQLVYQGKLLSGKYTVVATNPPYMNKYSPRLKDYINRRFHDYRGDLFSVFMYRSFGFCKEGGYCGLMTPMVWMFLKTYEPLRRYLLSEKAITTLIQFEYSAFEDATVPISAFVLQNAAQTSKALCFRLTAFPGGMEVQKQKILEAIANKNCGYFYEADPSGFAAIPTSPIAYWLSNRFFAAFEHQTLGNIARPRQGLATGCNELFVRRWYEVSKDQICVDAESGEDAKRSGKKWFPYNKGGEFRKWYGNDDYLVNWENDGAQIRNFKNEAGQLRSRPQNMQFYFRPAISWSLISSGTVAFRYKPSGHIFDVAGMSLFAEENLFYLLGLCNSPVVLEALAVLAPTINFQAGDIANLPLVVDKKQLATVEQIVRENIEISRADYDAFETSRDFKKHPLL